MHTADSFKKLLIHHEILGDGRDGGEGPIDPFFRTPIPKNETTEEKVPKLHYKSAKIRAKKQK